MKHFPFLFVLVLSMIILVSCFPSPEELIDDLTNTPDAPTGVTAVKNGGDIDVSWTEVSGDSLGYTVYYSKTVSSFSTASVDSSDILGQQSASSPFTILSAALRTAGGGNAGDENGDWYVWVCTNGLPNSSATSATGSPITIP